MIVSIVSVIGVAADQDSGTKVKCPVSGEWIKKTDAKATHEYDGKTYYFCCESCKEAFLKDPHKYISEKSQEKHGHSCQQADATAVDPACGMSIKKSETKISIEYDGKTYFFCSQECKEKFLQDPEKYVNKDEEKVTCPVSGEVIRKSEAADSIEHEGKTYYFCCDGCKEKFVKNPEKYIKREHS
jgi:YHS domain-containing protein